MRSTEYRSKAHMTIRYFKAKTQFPASQMFQKCCCTALSSLSPEHSIKSSPRD